MITKSINQLEVNISYKFIQNSQYSQESMCITSVAV